MMAKVGRDGDGHGRGRPPARRSVLGPDAPAKPSIRDVPIETVLDHAEARWRPKLASEDPGTRTGVRATLTLIANLRPRWTGRKVGELTQRSNGTGSVDLYVRRRAGEDVASGRKGPDGGIKKVSRETAWSELTRLMAEVREYAAEHSMSDVPDVDLPTREPRTVAWLERHEVARLLWAVRGRVWDADAGDWKLDGDGRRVLTRRRDIGWVARLILILVYTGSTANCAARLSWSPSTDGERSHVDLDSVVEGRTAHLHRLGPDLASKRMAHVPVAICRRLAGHLRRWRALDGGRHERLLHLTGKRGSRKASEGTISIGLATIGRVCERAGLGDRVDLPTLGDTGAVWALRAGSRKMSWRVRRRIRRYRPHPAIVRSVSFMVGVDTRSFEKRFEHFTLEFQKPVMKGLRRPAKTVR